MLKILDMYIETVCRMVNSPERKVFGSTILEEIRSDSNRTERRNNPFSSEASDILILLPNFTCSLVCSVLKLCPI